MASKIEKLPSLTDTNKSTHMNGITPQMAKVMSYSSEWIAKVAVTDNYDNFARISRKPSKMSNQNLDILDYSFAKENHTKIKKLQNETGKLQTEVKQPPRTSSKPFHTTNVIPFEFKSLKRQRKLAPLSPERNPKTQLQHSSGEDTPLKRSTEKPSAIDISGAIISHKSSDSTIPFKPAVASLIDFRNNSNGKSRSILTRKYEFVQNDYINVPLEGTESRQLESASSTKFMANYLGVGDVTFKNAVSSVRVRPILPPIKSSGKFRRQDDKNFDNDKEVFLSRFRTKKKRNKKQSVEDITKRCDELAHEEMPNYCIYHPLPHHSPQVSESVNRTPREELEIVDGIDEDFDRVVRWRSKARYSHKPAMFRRITSPTLGEKALRKKLTDRLPSRRLQKLPDAKDLHSNAVDKHERWHRPPSIIPNHQGKEKTRQRKRYVHAFPAQSTSLHELLTSRAQRITGSSLESSRHLPVTERKPLRQRL